MERNQRSLARSLSRGLLAKLGMAVVLLLAACPKGDDAPARAGDLADRLGVENPVGDRVAQQVTTAVPRAAIQTEISLLRRTIRTHRHITGSFPASLDDLQPSIRLTYPDEYTYDAVDGEVRSRTFPEL